MTSYTCLTPKVNLKEFKENLLVSYKMNKIQLVLAKHIFIALATSVPPTVLLYSPLNFVYCIKEGVYCCFFCTYVHKSEQKM
jgi:hypothetical protein